VASESTEGMEMATKARSPQQEAAAFLATLGENGGGNAFLADMQRAMVRFGSLTEKQLAATLKFRDRREEWAKADAERAEKLKNAPDAPDGRGTVTGEVKSCKLKDTQWGETYKMVVEGVTGNRVYCSVPATLLNLAIAETLVGQQVCITAEWKRSDDDSHFSFGSRPSGSLVGEAL
jgi:hypothetical protein